MGKLKGLLVVLGVNVVVIFIIFIILELISRTNYSEFKGHTHSSELTLGQTKVYSNQLKGFEGIKIRVPYAEYELDENKDTVLVLGDSISDGYGSAYNDIYWYKFQRLISTIGIDNVQTVSFSGQGYSLADMKAELKKYTDSQSFPNVRMMLYQFNYNDITRHNSKKLKGLDNATNQVGRVNRFAKWRYKYLNKSVFLRVVQHYAGVFSRKRSGSCIDRETDALGAYSWSFGSKVYKEQSEGLWLEFQKDLDDVKRISNKIGAKLVILVSPILYDIDKEGRHPYYNSYNLDFSCATIEPNKRLKNIAEQLNIDVVDPTGYIKGHYEQRIRENNFTSFFFTADDNHFTPVTGAYIAEYLAAYYKNNMSDSGQH